MKSVSSHVAAFFLISFHGMFSFHAWKNIPFTIFCQACWMVVPAVAHNLWLLLVLPRNRGRHPQKLSKFPNKTFPTTEMIFPIVVPFVPKPKSTSWIIYTRSSTLKNRIFLAWPKLKHFSVAFVVNLKKLHIDWYKIILRKCIPAASPILARLRFFPGVHYKRYIISEGCVNLLKRKEEEGEKQSSCAIHSTRLWRRMGA